MLWQKLLGACRPNVTSLSFLGTDSISRADSSTAFSFASEPLGAASPDRIIIVGVFGFRANATVGSNPAVTVAGVSATRVIDRNASLSVSASLTLFAVALPTGTTGTISVSHGSATACGIGIYRMVKGSPSLTPSDTDSLGYSANSPASISASLTTRRSSAVVGFSCSVNGIDPTWTGITKDEARDINSNEWFAAASKYPANVNGTLSTTTSATLNSTAGVILASWS